MSTAIYMAARHLLRPALLSGSKSTSLLSNSTTNQTASSSTPLQIIARSRIGSNSDGYSNSSSFAVMASATTLMATCALSIAHCQDPSTTGPADETEDPTNGDNIIIQDGIDAGSERPISNSYTDETAAEEDDDDDPNNDEETNCSICLINRQGPCRKYWLKFERCMKDHSAEKERREKEAGNDVHEKVDREPTMEEEWDLFMEKSIKPGEGDEENEEEEEEEDEDDKEETIDDHNDTEPSLGERCDKFMIPWISCIQEHRNVYSLISNAFYQKDYVDPLEDSVPDHQRRPFTKIESSIGEKGGYIVKYLGAEVDLGNWREHVEADADESEDCFSDEEDDTSLRESHKNIDELHLINAYAKFKLTEPDTGNPIEVAYIKDQQGRLLGFDSFSKRDSSENIGDDIMHTGQDKVHDGSTMEHRKFHDGECTFHIVPEETTSVAAYAIYRSKRVDDKGEEQKEYILYYTPHILLPGNQNDK